MYDPTNIIVKLRFTGLGFLVLITATLIFAVLPTPESRACIATSNTSASPSSISDSQNAVTNIMSATAGAIMQSADSAGRSVECSSQSAGKNVSHGAITIGHIVGNVGVYAGHSLEDSAVSIASGISSSSRLMISIPASMVNFASDTAVVSAVIKPTSNTPIPIIDPALPAKIATQTQLPTVTTVSQIAPPQIALDSTPSWPIHGEITTLFGVPHWPYQPTHTGLDISDGQPAGRSEIKPFKPGHVIDIVRSNIGLGNHVIIDHGDGITSVYGHLASIVAVIGQAVDKTTVLGFEGSSGASTGTHLHFEIRVDGQAKDPLQFIPGRP